VLLLTGCGITLLGVSDQGERLLIKTVVSASLTIISLGE